MYLIIHLFLGSPLALFLHRFLQGTLPRPHHADLATH